MRSRTALGAVLVALLLASGCSSDPDEPSALPEVSPAASPTTAATTPDVPPSAQAETPQGAAEFARFWFKVLNESVVSGDTVQLRALSDPACFACNGFADSIDTLYREAGGLRGSQFTVVAAEAPAFEGEPVAAVTVIYDVSETEYLGKSGSVTKRIPALSKVRGEMTLQRRGSAWNVKELVTT